MGLLPYLTRNTSPTLMKDGSLIRSAAAPAWSRLSYPPYTLPGLQGYGIPVVQDTQELAPAWHDRVSSAKVIYDTWRLFADPDFQGFMGDYKAPADVPYLIPLRQLDSLQCLAGEPPPPPPPRY